MYLLKAQTFSFIYSGSVSLRHPTPRITAFGTRRRLSGISSVFTVIGYFFQCFPNIKPSGSVFKAGH